MPFENGARYLIEIIPPPFVGGWYITGNPHTGRLTAEPRNPKVAATGILPEQIWTIEEVKGKPDVYKVYGQLGGYGSPALGWGVNDNETLPRYIEDIKEWDLKPIPPNDEELASKIRLQSDAVEENPRWFALGEVPQIILATLWSSPQPTDGAEAATTSPGALWKFTKVKDEKPE